MSASTDLGLGIWSNPRIYTYPATHVFVGRGCASPSDQTRLFPPNNRFYQTAEIRSKHGLILDCSLQLTNPSITTTAIESLTQWAHSFHQGKRYGFLHMEAGQEAGQDADFRTGDLHLRCERILDVKAWLEDAIKCDLDSSS